MGTEEHNLSCPGNHDVSQRIKIRTTMWKICSSDDLRMTEQINFIYYKKQTKQKQEKR